MTVLFLNWRDIKNPEAGGAEIYLHEIAKRMIKDGNKVDFLSAKFKGCKDEEIIDGVRYIRKGGRITVHFKKLKRLKDEGYNLIIEAQSAMPFFMFRPDIFIYWHKRDRQSMKETRLSWLVNFIDRHILPRHIKRAHFVAISKSSSRDAINDGLSSNPVVAEPGIGKEFIKECLRTTRKSANPSIIYVGRLKKYKRVDLLITAYRCLLNEMPELKYDSPMLYIIGCGDDEARLKALAASYHLEEYIKFEGFIPEKRKLDLIRKAWFAVNPSSAEGWGITSIECAACGTPTIGSTASGLRDSIIDDSKDEGKGTGFIFTDGLMLCDAMKAMISNPLWRKRLGMNGKRFAKQFTWDRTYSRIFLRQMQKQATGESNLQYNQMACAYSRSAKY